MIVAAWEYIKDIKTKVIHDLEGIKSMDGFRTVKVVAIGDSLTAGYTTPSRYNSHMHNLPYTNYLDNIIITAQSRMGQTDVDVVIVNLGRNGDSARGMLDRLTTEAARHKPDYVIVWGGINGLFSKPPEETLQSLIKLYDRVKEIGAKPIACTLTSVANQSKAIDTITYVNELITDYCNENGIPVADLFKATSYENHVLRVEYSSDGLHLTARGYQKVAETIFKDVIEDILKEYQ